MTSSCVSSAGLSQRGCAIADELGHGQLLFTGGLEPAAVHLVHPGAGALAGAGVEVEVEVADGFAVTAQLEEADRLVPHRRLGLADLHVEHALDDAESPATTLGAVKYCFTSWSLKA